MKIDLHTHILPREWPNLDAKYGYAGFVRLDHYKPCCARMMIGDRVFREITDNVWDPKRRIEEMDREKISMQVNLHAQLSLSLEIDGQHARRAHRLEARVPISTPVEECWCAGRSSFGGRRYPFCHVERKSRHLLLFLY